MAEHLLFQEVDRHCRDSVGALLLFLGPLALLLLPRIDALADQFDPVPCLSPGLFEAQRAVDAKRAPRVGRTPGITRRKDERLSSSFAHPHAKTRHQGVHHVVGLAFWCGLEALNAAVVEGFLGLLLGSSRLGSSDQLGKHRFFHDDLIWQQAGSIPGAIGCNPLLPDDTRCEANTTFIGVSHMR